MTTIGENLVDALRREITRVREEVLPAYIKIGRPGAYAAVMLKEDLAAAERALAEQDVVACVRLFRSLKGAN